MPAPYDYTIKSTNPFLAGLQGYQMAQEQRKQAMKLEQEKMAMAQAQRQQQRQMEFQDRMAAIAQNPYGSGEAYNQLAAQYPEMMKLSEQVRGMRSEQQLKNDVSIVQKINAAMAAGNYDVAKSQMEEYRNGLQNSGRQNEMQSIDNMIGMVDDPEKRKEIAVGLNNYLRSQMGAEEYLKYFDKISGVGGAKAQPVGGGLIIEDPETGTKSMITGSFDPNTQSLKIVSGEIPGTLLSRLGETPEEQTARAALETGKKKAAEVAITTSEKYGEKADLARERITKLDEAIRITEQAISEGKTLGKGWIESKLPKLSKFPILIQQAGRELGLGVIQSTTFGALNADEMKLAMETALPDFPNDQDTLDWLKRKRAAEEKLQNELNRAAIFLGQPGNTVADWRKLQTQIRAGKITPESAYGETPPEQTTSLVPGQTQTTREVPVTEKLKSASTADLFKQLQQSMGQ